MFPINLRVQWLSRGAVRTWRAGSRSQQRLLLLLKSQEQVLLKLRDSFLLTASIPFSPSGVDRE
jgi:hypothetical protein